MNCHNGATCNHVNGSCTCAPGYRGKRLVVISPFPSLTKQTSEITLPMFPYFVQLHPAAHPHVQLYYGSVLWEYCAVPLSKTLNIALVNLHQLFPGMLRAQEKVQWYLPEQLPLLSDHLSKIPIGSSVSQIAISETSCKCPPLLSDHLSKILIGSSVSQIAIVKLPISDHLS